MCKRPLSGLSCADTLVAPSILAADFSILGEEIRRVEIAGADMIHVDVMDGHFVPNISIGPPVVEKIRGITGLPFDVHLMISRPLSYVGAFAAAGADGITFHLEADDDPAEVIKAVRREGCSVGLCLKPASPAESVFEYLDAVDLVLVMTVEPGFGGQKFMADMMPKMRALRDEIDSRGLRVHLEVDGGIDESTVGAAVGAGANVLVAGTAVFRHPLGAEHAIGKLKSPA